MTDDIEALRQAAGAATPGPWWAGDIWVYTDPVYPDDHRLSDVLGMKFADEERAAAERERGLRNTAHIATFDPTTVLALLDRLEAAEGFASLWKRVAKKLAGDVREVELIDSGLRQAVVTIAFQRDAARAECDALRSVIQSAGAALLSASIPPGVTEVQFYRDLVGETFRILSRTIDTKEKP